MIVSDPNPAFQIDEARRQIAAGRLDDAARLLEKLVEAHPRCGEAWLLLAAVFGTHRKLDDSIRCGERAVALLPDSADANFNLAQAYVHQRRCDAAIPHYLAVVNQRPDHYEAVNNLALSYLAVKQDEEGARWLRAAHALRPEAEATRFLAAVYRQAESPDRAPPQYVAEFFDGFADTFDEKLVRKLQYRTPELLATAIQRHIGERRGFDILDLGCGTGLMAAWLKPLAQQIVGVDVSRRMVEKARQRGLYDRLHVVDILQFSPPGAEFDLVAAVDVLGYFGDCDALFGKVRSLLRHGGLFACSTERGPEDGADWYLHSGGRYAHAERYIRRCAESRGFRECACTTGILRMEQGQTVTGNLWLFEPVTAGSSI